MTPRQKADYKRGNQERKARLVALIAASPKPERGYWSRTIGLIQDGKFTKR